VGSDSIAQAEFSKIAEAIGSNAKGVDDVRKLLSDSSSEHNWLLVLDNADDLDTDYQKYFPTGNRGAVLMTSRVRECGRYGTVGSEEIDSLAERDCVNLLLKGVGVPEASWSGYISAAKNIINVVQSHTLALLQAAAYIAGGHCSVAEYPEVFQRQRERLLKFGPKQAQSRYGNVYTTFEASVDVLKSFETETPAESLILLHLLSTLHYESVPLDLFEDAWHGSQVAQANPIDDDTIGHLSVWHVSQLPTFLRDNVDTWDPFRFTAALSQLESLALVKKNNMRGYWTVTMHPLVHSWLAIRQNHAQISRALQTSACIIALSRYSQPAWQRIGHPSWQLYRGCLGLHLLTLLSSDIKSAGQTKQSTHILQVFMQIGWLLHDIRYDQELAQLLDWIFQQLDADPECSSERVLLLSDIASRNTYNLGRTKKSIKISEEIVRIREAILNETHPERLESQQELASALLADGQTKRAITLFEHVVKVREATLDGGHPDRLASQYELARALLADGQTKQAITLFEHVVKVQETTLDGGHPDRLASQHGLACALLADSQTKQAITLFEHVVKVRETTLDEGHPDRLASQHELAHALLADGQTKQAITLFEHVVKVQETTLNEGHPNRLASQHGLASALLADSQTKQAITLFEHVANV
jgi:tetratricopeptide (TPR) repeat protein